MVEIPVTAWQSMLLVPGDDDEHSNAMLELSSSFPCREWYMSYCLFGWEWQVCPGASVPAKDGIETLARLPSFFVSVVPYYIKGLSDWTKPLTPRCQNPSVLVSVWRGSKSNTLSAFSDSGGRNFDLLRFCPVDP